MKSFYDKEEYSLTDIKSLIKNQVEESIYLDFKSKDALGKSEGKKKEISKDIASFANSDGGIIVYGINEENHKADSISFIDGNEFTKEWLEHVINATIQRRITDLSIIPIRENNDIRKSIYLVKIPKSLDTPHISKDKRYYRRYNFESVPMEEHEIRNLYGRKVKSRLVIDRCSIRQYDLEDEDRIKIYFEVDVYNDGDIGEGDYKVNVIIDNFHREMNLSWRPEKPYDYTRLDDQKVKISANSNMPIYPEETVTAIRFTVELPKEKELDLSEVKSKVILFYSNGEDEMEVDLIKQLGNQIKKEGKDK